MAVLVELTPEEEKRLREEAARHGESPPQYAGRLVRQGLRSPLSLAEILEPLWRQVEESGVTDEELDALVEEAREAVYRERGRGRTRP